MTTPSSCYHNSTRKWNGILKSPEYDTKDTIVRKVCQSGCIWLRGVEHYIGQALTGEYIALKTNQNDKLEVYYGPVYLGMLEEKGLKQPKLESRRQR
jgi:hypothetical protein